jgi:hypothetical protein
VACEKGLYAPRHLTGAEAVHLEEITDEDRALLYA